MGLIRMTKFAVFVPLDEGSLKKSKLVSSREKVWAYASSIFNFHIQLVRSLVVKFAGACLDGRALPIGWLHAEA